MGAKTILKWVIQFVLGWVFTFLPYNYLPGGGPNEAFILISFLIPMTFGSTIGVVLGDVKLYKRFRLSYGAVIAALFLAIVGFFFAFSFDELIQRFIPYSERNSLIRVAIGAAVMTVFPLITYNIITSKSRVQRKVNNQQQETPNS
ncbi:MAG: hypothetical protein ACYSR8_10595 [Planctomycetota bacterium]|jgi:hypothetical protein